MARKIVQQRQGPPKRNALKSDSALNRARGRLKALREEASMPAAKSRSGDYKKKIQAAERAVLKEVNRVRGRS